MLRSHLMTTGKRRGNILIVTLLLLALFATIGLTIVYYTKDLAERQRINIEAQSNGAAAFPDDGTTALNAYLGQLIYGSSNVNSNIYGQDVLRAMYGGQIGSTSAWTGAGSIHETVPLIGAVTLDRAQILNYGMVNIMGNTGVSPETSTAGFYIPKNAPYTYPDLKDFYLASICPATGEVLVPSYQRLAGFGSLNPSNPNWTNTQGMYMTPRPRPFDNGGAGSTFPPVPLNADGITYTGDVQNLPGGFFATSATGPPFIAKNDSIWIDIGLPPITLPNGKVVKPLVAPLIVDLDGLLNISVHGNVYSSLTTTSPFGGSGCGIGPWEVNLVRALPTDGLSLINARGVPRTQSGIASRSYNNYLYQASSTQQLPAYSSVPWNTGAGAAPSYLNLSGLGGNSVYSTNPTYSPTATSPYLAGYDSTNAPVTTPAILYNPVEWPTVFGSNAQAGLNSQGFPSDLQQLMSRYAASPYNYALPQLNLGGPSVTALTIRGNPAIYPFPTPSLPTYPAPQPSAGNPSNYRLDPANLNRGLLTPYAYSLDRQGFNPNYPGATGGLTWTAGTSLTGGVLSGSASTAFTPITGSVPALGPLDLNRPLSDYRTPAAITAGQPLSPTTMAPPSVTLGSTIVQQAVADRQQFAMSIFARLILASGAQGATFSFPTGVGENVTITAAPASLQFYALQALAQLAANIVDYIDTDDISTAFVWNSSVPGDPFNAANFAAGNIGNFVVFGVEKPRLVLSEAYGEIVNDPNDPAFTNATMGASTAPQVRFWLELMNPTSTPYANGVGPLGNGSVTVRYPTSGYSAYQIQIVRSDPGIAAGVNVSDVLRNPANPANAGNVTGAIVGTPADLTFNFSTADATPAVYTVLPSNGTANLPGSILLCAANVQQPPTNGPDFIFPNANINGAVNATLGQNVINGVAPNAAAQAAQTTLTYNSTTTLANSSTLSLANALQNNGTNGVSADLLQHVVLLQRLANPYMAPSPTNPYITVDYMDYVPAADRILLANGSKTNNPRKPYNKMSAPTGFNPLPASLGKVQPYAGWTNTLPVAQFPSPANGYATGTYPFTFPSSMVLPQKPTAQTTQTPIPGSAALAVQHTFGQFNSITPASPPVGTTYIAGSGVLAGGETIMTPFDWITQLDRSLINQTELFEVSMGKPHELTLRSIAPNTGNTDVSKFSNTFGVQAGFTTPIPTPAATVTTNTLLYRAMDTLRIQPYGQMTGLGGRVPGRININTIQDKRVWDALFDSQPWNTFTQTDVQNMWNSMIASRTGSMQTRLAANGSPLTDSYGVAAMTPVPGATVYDSTTGTDRPFLPFGAPAFAPGGIAYTAGGGGGLPSGLLADTLARNGNAGATIPPFIFAASNPGTHPYQQGEALRKIMNNTTTVSHTFAVWVTVGYFNYNSGVLGSEYYSSVPGDLRKKFFSVVDRSLVGLTPGTITQSLNQPFFSTIDGTTSLPVGSTTLPVTTSGPSQISINGTFLPLPGGTPGLGNTLAVGVGATQEVVTLAGAGAYTNNGVTAYTAYTIVGSGPGGGFQFPHWPGECISNIVPGNPGPQLNFSVTGSTPTLYNYVVPYWSRLQ